MEIPESWKTTTAAGHTEYTALERPNPKVGSYTTHHKCTPHLGPPVSWRPRPGQQTNPLPHVRPCRQQASTQLAHRYNQIRSVLPSCHPTWRQRVQRESPTRDPGSEAGGSVGVESLLSLSLWLPHTCALFSLPQHCVAGPDGPGLVHVLATYAVAESLLSCFPLALKTQLRRSDGACGWLSLLWHGPDTASVLSSVFYAARQAHTALSNTSCWL